MFVGGAYKDNDPAKGMSGQMYVFYQIPAGYQPGRNGKWPIIMVHGSQQTGANFLGTPDGRSGWAWYFLQRGWPVYVVDQPGRGKSGYVPEAYGPQGATPTVGQVQSMFTAPELATQPAWPQAPLHTQWPGGRGSGTPGNPAFDEFMASQVANLPDFNLALSLTTKALGKLLDRIGPSILLTHSMAGPLSWMVPQANPGKIKAVIAVEPSGNSGPRGDTAPGMVCGLSVECLNYAPPIQSAAGLGLTRVAAPSAELQSCWLQTEPAHRLTGFDGVPVLIATAEASYHAAYDYCTGRFLTQAGVTNEWVNLASVGIHGTGHMQMLESNSTQIADFYEKWLSGRLSGP